MRCRLSRMITAGTEPEVTSSVTSEHWSATLLRYWRSSRLDWLSTSNTDINSFAEDRLTSYDLRRINGRLQNRAKFVRISEQHNCSSVKPFSHSRIFRTRCRAIIVDSHRRRIQRWCNSSQRIMPHHYSDKQNMTSSRILRLKRHQISFPLGIWPTPRWRSPKRSPRLPSLTFNPPPHIPFPRHLWRLFKAFQYLPSVYDAIHNQHTTFVSYFKVQPFQQKNFLIMCEDPNYTRD